MNTNLCKDCGHLLKDHSCPKFTKGGKTFTKKSCWIEGCKCGDKEEEMITISEHRRIVKEIKQSLSNTQAPSKDGGA